MAPGMKQSPEVCASLSMVTWLQLLTLGLLVVPSRTASVFLATPFWSVERKHSPMSSNPMGMKAYLKNVLKVVRRREMAGALLARRTGRGVWQKGNVSDSSKWYTFNTND